ncbi:MAG: DUF560 domain-containing protein [Bacteroidetes bacterium]|nr:DUF560 domain-containing protein [Bacteroidota bacterium]
MRTMRITGTGIAMMLILQIASAQMETDLSVMTMADDNVYNNADMRTSAVTSLSFSSGYAWLYETSEFRLFYDGTYSYYTDLTERTNHYHSLNAGYAAETDADGNDILRVLLSAGTGLNRDGFVLYDRQFLSASADWKQLMSERFVSKIAYDLRMVDFPLLQDFSYTEHAFMMNGAYAVTPTTTAIVQADLGTKFYGTETETSSASMRKGIMSSILPSVTQLTGMLKVGQGLGDGIGLSASLRYQWNIQKQTRYLSSEYGYISDDELFDDHYGYEGLHSSIVYTHHLTGSLLGRLTLGVQNKRYSSLAALDIDGNIIADQRIDTRYYMNVLLEHFIESSGITLKLAVDMIGNRSNDVYYDYRNTAVTLECGIPF